MRLEAGDRALGAFVERRRDDRGLVSRRTRGGGGHRSRPQSVVNKEERSMKKISCLGVAAALAASIAIVPGLATAQDKPTGDKPLTQQQVKGAANQAATVAQQKWNSLTPAQQQQI